jgi:hypothetical protein
MIASEKYKQQRTSLDSLGQVLRVADAGDQQPAREVVRGHESELTKWITDVHAWFAECDDESSRRVGKPLEKENTQVFLDVVREFRRDLDDNVFSPGSRLGRLSAETRHGAALRRSTHEAAYRLLLEKLEPYHRVVNAFADTPWAGSTNPIEINEAAKQLHRDSNSIIDAFAAYRQTVTVFLEELVRLIREPD